MAEMVAGREIRAPVRALPRVEERQVKIITLKKLVLMRFLRHRMAVGGLAVVIFMTLFAFVGPFLSPFQPDQVNLRERFSTPSLIMVKADAGKPAVLNLAAVEMSRGEDARPLVFGHPLGTDDLGRDTMTRAMFGGRVSLGIGFVVALVSVGLGATVGAISGYLGGIWDNIIMRFNDVENSLPDLPILMVISKLLP